MAAVTICKVILHPPKIKYLTVSIVSPSICHEIMEPDVMIFVFQMLSFKPVFSLIVLKAKFTYLFDRQFTF